VELIVADAEGRDMRALGDFSLQMGMGWGDGVENTFELQCSEGVPQAGWRVYADGTEVGGRVESYKLQTSRTGRILKWCGSSWPGVLEKRLLWPDAGSDYLTWSGDAAGMLKWAVARLGLSGLFPVPQGSAGADVSLKCSRDEPDAWTNLRLALRAAGLRMRGEWSHGACSLSAEPVARWADRVDTDLLDFDLEGTLLCRNHLLIAGKGELAERSTRDLWADASGAITASRALSGPLQVDYFYDSSSTEDADLEAEGAEKLLSLQSQGKVDVDVRDGWEPGLGDVIEGSDRAMGVTVVAEVCGREVEAAPGWCKSSYVADGSVAALGA